MSRKLIPLLFLAQTALADSTTMDFQRPDHRLHGAVSYGLTLTGTAFFRKAGLDPVPAFLASGLLTMSAGIIKEASDKEFSVGDLKADAFGTLTSGVFSLVIQF